MTSLQIIVGYQLKAKNAPNVQRASQSENKRCQKYGGRSPFKLTVLSVIHISGCNLDKKQDCEDKVNHGKDHVIDNTFDLSSCGDPSVLDSPCYIARACRKSRYT